MRSDFAERIVPEVRSGEMGANARPGAPISRRQAFWASTDDVAALRLMGLRFVPSPVPDPVSAGPRCAACALPPTPCARRTPPDSLRSSIALRLSRGACHCCGLGLRACAKPPPEKRPPGRFPWCDGHSTPYREDKVNVDSGYVWMTQGEASVVVSTPLETSARRATGGGFKSVPRAICRPALESAPHTRSWIWPLLPFVFPTLVRLRVVSTTMPSAPDSPGINKLIWSR